MRKIVQKYVGNLSILVSPSWLPGKHIESLKQASVLAEDIVERRCLIEPVGLNDRALESGSNNFKMDQPTYIYPVIWKDGDGCERCLNDISRFIATESLCPRQRIFCFIAEEEQISSERIKLIDFRFRLLDAVIMPTDQKTKKRYADLFINQLDGDDDLVNLIESYWFGRHTNRLSAADKSRLVNGAISRTKFQPSHLLVRESPVDRHSSGDRIQSDESTRS